MSFADRRERLVTSAYWLHTSPRRYLFALVVVLAATLCRYALGILIGSNLPFILFYPAILLVAWTVGLRPGVFAVFLFVVSARYLFSGSSNEPSFGLPRDTNGLILFAIAGVAISGVADMYRRRAKRMQEFEKAVESMEEMMVVVDRDYRYLTVNHAFLSYRGMKSEDLIGRSISEMLDPNVFEMTVKKKLDECFRGKIVQFEIRYTSASQGERDLLVSYFPIEGPDGVDRVAALLKDITEHKQAQLVVEQKELLFRTLVESAPMAMVVSLGQGQRAEFYNSKFTELFGYLHEEVPDIEHWWPLAYPDEEYRRQISEQWNREVRSAIERKGETPPIEARVRCKDGSYRDVEFKLVCAGDKNLVFGTDITEIKESERALKLFRTLIDQSNDAVEVVDPDTLRFLDVNEKACQALGYSRDELLSKTVRDIDPGFDESSQAEVLEQLHKSGSLVREGIHRRKDGSLFPIEISIKLVQLGRSYVVAVSRDISDRKKAEGALRESEDRYRDLIENSQDLVCTHDLEGRFLSMNPAPARKLGYEVAELMKMPMRDVVAPEFREQFDAYLSRIKANGADKGYLAVVTRTGERRIWEYNNTLRTEGVASPVVRGMARDVTERKRAEAALRNSEQRYRLLFEKTVAGAGIISIEGQVVDCNDAWARMFGYGSATECRGVEVAKHYFDLADREALLKELRKSGAVTNLELHLRRKDGTPLWILVNDVLLSDSQNPRLIQATVMDITARKEAEAALQRREEDYRRFVAQSSEGIFRQDLDKPIPVDLPEDEIVHRILYDSYLAECNDAIAKMYGVAAQDFIGKRLTETLDPNDPHNIELTREYVRLGFRVVERESHEVDIHGNPKVFLNSLIGIVENGMLLRTWGIQRDVTEQVKLEEARSRAERALQASEAHFRHLVEQASDGIFIADANGKYLDVNSAGAQMLGYTRDEVLQLSIPDILIAGDASRIAPEVSLMAEGAVVRSEWTFRRKDGSLFPGEVCGKQLPDGRLQGILRDITERRQAEEAMRRNEQRFRVALKDSPIMVFNQDLDLRYTWIYNPQLYWEHDAMGKTDEEIIGPKKATRLVELKRKALKTGGALREDVVIPLNGKNCAFDITIEPLFDADGKIVGITGTSMDIARFREMADRLQDARDKLAQEKSYLEGEIEAELGFEEIIGQSPALRDVLKKARVVAPTDSSVLLLGETGTGKELVARSVHSLSLRHDKTFIKLNCAAVPEGLLESELFGHEKGAFTGAVNQKVGRIELADKGTLFLDEIGELPLDLQPKLLRVLQDREFERLGGVHTLHVDVRIISATNRDLHQDIVDRKFREDLYYRLNVFPIQLPALRERRSDIPILVRHFVRKHSARMGKHIDNIPDEAMQVLQNWNWPGNIRELENMIERMVILSKARDLAPPPVELAAPQDVTDDNLTEMEREHIIRILRETNGVLSGDDGAASRLGIKRTTLQSMLKRFNIDLREFRRANGTFGPD